VVADGGGAGSCGRWQRGEGEGASDGGRAVTVRELRRPVSSSSVSPLASSWAWLQTAAVQGAVDGG
jgi:hypothetical protein